MGVWVQSIAQILWAAKIEMLPQLFHNNMEITLFEGAMFNHRHNEALGNDVNL